MRQSVTSCLLGWIFVSCGWVLTTRAQSTPSTQSVSGQGSAETVQVRQLQARVDRLQVTIDQQAADIQSLKATIAVLNRQLVEAGLAPLTGDATTQPAKAPQKVLFVVASHAGLYGVFHAKLEAAHTEITKAISDMGPGQTFNVFYPTPQGYVALHKGSFLPATAENRRRTEEFLKGQPLGGVKLEEGLKRGLSWGADVIWVLAVGEMKEGEEMALAVREANARRQVPIHTVLGYTNNARAASNHVLWQLAKDSGGTCINEKGEVADEPVVPAVVVEVKPAPPATKPSVLKVR